MRTGASPGGEAVEHYTHERMVNWLGLGELLRTGVRTAIATTVGEFSDAREVQAALNPAAGNPPILLAEPDHGAQQPVWIDYVADTGDGWDATYSVSWCLGREQLDVCGTGPGSGPAIVLPRADLLVLGGDQVYPTPARNAYRTRFVDPYSAALPATGTAERPDGPDRPDRRAPMMLALPGNHDWYDGLRGFSRLFCNQLSIGRWRTVQRTSYFAVSLPHGWWLWGLDLQLESELDRPQRDYFEAIAASRLAPGDRVIICTPEPSWIDESERLAREPEYPDGEAQAPRFRGLRQIEQAIARSQGARLVAVIAGDLHHYAHYRPIDPAGALPRRITCGGGGAYTLGTHQLPDTLNLHHPGFDGRYERGASYPDAATSRRLRNGAIRLPIRNPVFCGLLALAYLLYLWVLQSASKVPNVALGKLSLVEYLAQYSLSLDHAWRVLPVAVLRVMAHSPASVVLTLAILAGTAAFTASGLPERRTRAAIGGAVHGLLHLVLALALLWWIGRFDLGVIAPWLGYTPAEFIDHPLQVLMFIGQAVAVGGLLGGLLFGSWMVGVNVLFGWHEQEVFSSQGIADYKSFLRMRIDRDGLTLYPLGLRRSCKRWRVGAGIALLERAGRRFWLRAGPDGSARFEPVDPIEVELIEAPVHIPSHASPDIVSDIPRGQHRAP